MHCKALCLKRCEEIYSSYFELVVCMYTFGTVLRHLKIMFYWLLRFAPFSESGLVLRQ